MNYGKSNTTYAKDTLVSPKKTEQAHDVLLEIKIENIKTEITGVCRVCLKVGSIGIFSYPENEIALALQTFGGIDVLEEDGLPKYLCDTCFDILQKAILFRTTAQESDKILKTPVKELKSTVTKTDIIEIDQKNTLKTDKSQHVQTNTIKTNLKLKKSNNNNKLKHCKRCNLYFDELQKYKDHFKSEEHKSKKTKCEQCDMEVKAMYLRRHIFNKHNNLFICDICGKELTPRNKFRHFKLEHSNRFPYQCDLCPYKGNGPDVLRIHMRTHLIEKPYKCQQCGKSFVNKSNLNKHILVQHTKEKNFKCELCAKTYYTKRELNQHVDVVHSGIMNYTCDICFKAFGYKKQVRKHQIKVHKIQKSDRSGRLPLYLIKEQQNKSE